MTTREIIERLKFIRDVHSDSDETDEHLNALIAELESTYVETSSGPVIAAEWTKGSKGCGD